MSDAGEILGWTWGLNRMGDPTGIAHLLVAVRIAERLTGSRTACGSAGRTSGQVERRPPEGTHPCTRCARYAQR